MSNGSAAIDRLKPKHRRFVEEYLDSFNAKEAARQAGYGSRNPHSTAYRLMRRPDIAAAIEAALGARTEEIRITADRVVQEYAKIAFADMRDFANWGPEGVTMRPKEELGAREGAIIAGFDRAPGDGQVAQVRLYDKKAALDALARHLGMFDPKRPVEDAMKADLEARNELAERLLRMIAKQGAS